MGWQPTHTKGRVRRRESQVETLPDRPNKKRYAMPLVQPVIRTANLLSNPAESFLHLIHPLIRRRPASVAPSAWGRGRVFRRIPPSHSSSRRILDKHEAAYLTMYMRD
eukprot:43182-Eustigmatos_ZCMA.PRE.1